MTLLPVMFPIIPQHLTGRAASLPESRRKVVVVVAEAVPALTWSPPIALDSIVHDRLDKHEVRLCLDHAKLLVPKDSNSNSWVRHARVAPDCHSYNVLVHRVPLQGAVRLQTVRELSDGEELFLWFKEDVLASASIPFLVPSNIQGEKNYLCHICGKHFEYPNPLKIHLSLECGTLRRVELWKRLAKLEEAGNTSINLTLEKDKPGTFKLQCVLKEKGCPKAWIKPPSSPESSAVTSASITRSDEEPSEPAFGRYSAFKPYLSFQTKPLNSCYTNPVDLLSIPGNLIFSSARDHLKVVPSQLAAIALQDDLAIPSLDRQAEEMETLVSNLGRSKQGHRCIYCGKIYSRKYGLKIHIRTHTGFKPLKCKFCLRPFGDPSNLNKHVRLHSEGETPYKCEECGKVLVRRRDLERHMKSRHQQDTGS